MSEQERINAARVALWQKALKSGSISAEEIQSVTRDVAAAKILLLSLQLARVFVTGLEHNDDRFVQSNVQPEVPLPEVRVDRWVDSGAQRPATPPSGEEHQSRRRAPRVHAAKVPELQPQVQRECVAPASSRSDNHFAVRVRQRKEIMLFGPFDSRSDAANWAHTNYVGWWWRVETTWKTTERLTSVTATKMSSTDSAISG